MLLDIFVLEHLFDVMHCDVYFVDCQDTHIDDTPCPIRPTLEELCHSLTSNSSWLCQHSPINSPPPPSTFHTGIGGHRRCEIDEGALVKMSAGDHWPERERERGRESIFWGGGGDR